MVVTDWPKMSPIGLNFTKKLEKMEREASGNEGNGRTFDFIFCCVLEKSGRGGFIGSNDYYSFIFFIPKFQLCGPHNAFIF